jgi:hypothetical protein
MLLIVIAIKSSTGHISSLPIQKSTMKTNFTSTGEVGVIIPELSPTLLKADATSKITLDISL